MGKIVSINKRRGERSMAKIDDVAKWFLSKESMTNLKLQKLCYYAQAWHLAIYQTPLVDTYFEAWVHGPVSPVLYQQYKKWRWFNIPRYYGQVSLTNTEVAYLEKVYQLYGKYSGEQLEGLSHKEDPWKNARAGRSSRQYCMEDITHSDMENYYKRKLNRGKNIGYS